MSSSPSTTLSADDIRALRVELQGALADLGGLAPPVAPIAFRQHDEGPLRIWADDTTLTVHTIAGERGTVWICAARDMQWWPDWTALSASQARDLGMALLGAASDSENDLTHASQNAHYPPPEET